MAEILRKIASNALSKVPSGDVSMVH